MSHIPSSEEDKTLAARVTEAVGLCRSRGFNRFIGFLDMHERAVAQKTLDCLCFQNFLFWGGYEQAERVYLGFFDDSREPDKKLFPLNAVRITWRRGNLTHRDFLGSVLSLGLDRKRIGDIIVDEGNSILFVEDVLAEYIARNLVKVGGTGVKCTPGIPEFAERRQEFKDLSDTVASPRLDCVTASLVNVSRAEAAKLIATGKVCLDFQENMNPTYKVDEKSTVSIRGYGRFLIDRIGPVTKKGRFSLKARKYI